MTLSGEQLSDFSRDGFVRGPRVLDDVRLASLRAEVERIVAELPEGTRPENIRDPHEKSAFFRDFCLDGPVVAMAEQLLGTSDILLWGSYGFAKRPSDGLPVDWHQDGRYFPLTPMETVTCWIAVDDADRENGCLQMVPSSHKARRFMDHVTHEDWGKTTAIPLGLAAPDTKDAVYLEMPAGWCSFHDPYIVHGSGPNLSDRPRRGIQVLYMTHAVRLDTGDEQAMGLDWNTVRLYHCRGGGAYHHADDPGRVLRA
ncbi:MAG: phytanoyl-CoA dioxygenase family protein [Rhodospirillaceae bacterium]|jgi:ectoine hydroxylase-related dioxygenase (phytanoyl-CoA dioxygenase family)|nr:phytanoyl-CoA dioxygenase family protein [Rhodospirillaceae bacterium]